MSNDVLLQRYLSYKLQLEQQKNLRYSLPHLYAHKFYDFQVEFIKNNKDKIQILAAANQLGKSTSQIIKAIEWGFSDDDFRIKTWTTFNENIGREVSLYDPYSDKLLFFYLYPDEETALREFKTKWLKYLPKLELLPEDLREKYAWSVNSGYNKNIEFLKEINNLSLRKCDIFFLTYGKNVLTMQASTAHAVFSDEELPEILYSELNVRLRATNGFFHMVYTCTRGELSWYRAMECIGSPEETFVGAWKRVVSLWDCQKYSDGSYSMWSPNRIREEEKKCLCENDRLIRIEGRSIMSSDQLLVKYFENDLVVKNFTLPLDWEVWCGIDIGSGGKNHKSAITITGVPPDRKSCVVLECWREDELPTSEDDVLRMYKKMIAKYNRAPITFYDYAAKDFERLMLADSSVTMYKAEKSHEIGFGIMNTLMKAKRVKFVEGSHVYKLIQEMKTVKEKDPKHKRLDDVTDSFRYSLARIPFDTVDLHESIEILPKEEQSVKIETKEVDTDRGGRVIERQEKVYTDYEKEIMDYNDLISL